VPLTNNDINKSQDKIQNAYNTASEIRISQEEVNPVDIIN
jgi:hypothetical protein